MKKIIAYCGLICSECPVYIATQTGNEELKEQLARDYSTDTCKFEKNDMTCTGCHSINGVNEKMCVDCPMRKCGMEKKVSHCAQCNDYPCQYIEDYVPIESDNRKALEELAKQSRESDCR